MLFNRLAGCEWAEGGALDYLAHHRAAAGREWRDRLLDMARGLRTDMKTRVKSKYKGKEHLYIKVKANGARRERKSKKAGGRPKHYELLDLDISSCSRVLDENIEKLVSAFPNLQVLRIGNNRSLTDRSLNCVAAHLHKLTRLDISFLSVSEAAVRGVVTQCRRLAELETGPAQLPATLLPLLQHRGVRLVTGRAVAATNQTSTTDYDMMD